MALGNSAGRSGKNRTAEGANRRNTQRERAYIDPVLEPKEDKLAWILTARGHRLMDWFAWTCWGVFCVTLALVVSDWWGLL